MHEKRNRLQAILNAADFPGEILTGVPVVELHGCSEAVVIHHRGVIAYDAERICVSSSIGPVTVLGKALVIFRMNRERIVVHGTVCSVCLKGEPPC